jgi:hypothetical protein
MHYHDAEWLANGSLCAAERLRENIASRVASSEEPFTVSSLRRPFGPTAFK